MPLPLCKLQNGQRALFFDALQIKATKVTGNIWMLEGAGGSIGVSVSEEVSEGLYDAASQVCAPARPFCMPSSRARDSRKSPERI